jgi:hypothetical protein
MNKPLDPIGFVNKHFVKNNKNKLPKKDFFSKKLTFNKIKTEIQGLQSRIKLTKPNPPPTKIQFTK